MIYRRIIALFIWLSSLGANAAPGVADFTSSNLPIVTIDTGGKAIPQRHRIAAQMGIIWNEDESRNHLAAAPNHYAGRIEIELRGKSSLSFPKKSLRLETQDPQGENLNVSLLGLPKENDWILYAPYTDKTLMRNALAYTLAARMGRYAPRVRFCEVVLNKAYIGVYVLSEKIKRDGDRVDLVQMGAADLRAPEISGGYIFKKDKRDPGDNIITTSQGVDFIIIEPGKEEIVGPQTNWLRNHLNDFEEVLSAAGDIDAYIDLLSFVDNFLLVELSKNIDGYRLSTYYHKDRGGKIAAGPVWDYNLSFGNADYLAGWTPVGWYYLLLDRADIYWYSDLIRRQSFRALRLDRWAELRRRHFNTLHIFALIDGWAKELEEAQQRNFARYPILGRYVWPNPGFPESGSFGTRAPTTGGALSWAEEIGALKGFIEERLKWMDRQLGLASVQVTVQVAERGTGNIFVNNQPLPAGIYTTTRGADIPLALSARPTAGYRFEHWEERPITRTASATFIARGARWKYLDDGSDQGIGWRRGEFDDAAWKEGPAELGYGDDDEATQLGYGPDPADKFATTYFRKAFAVEDPRAYHVLTLHLLRDDGALVYLNGHEVVRSNMPAAAAHDGFAAAWVADQAERTFIAFPLDPAYLVEGENLLAVEIHQSGPSSSDISFDLELEGGSAASAAAEVIGRDGELLYRPQRDAIVRALFRPLGTALLDQSPVPAAAFLLRQNYPNPFNPATLFEYQLAVDSKVELAVYDITGQKVAKLLAAPQRAGLHRFEWHAGDLASGVYFYRLTAAAFTQTKKCVLLK